MRIFKTTNRLLLRCCVVSLVVGQYSVAAYPIAAQQHSLSLEETRLWLERRVSETSYRTRSSDGQINTRTYDLRVFNDCDANLEVIYDLGDAGAYLERYDFNLGRMGRGVAVTQLNLSSTEVDGPYWTLLLVTADYARTIIPTWGIIRFSEKGFPKLTPSAVNTIYIYFRDYSLAQRVSRAFSHAIAICESMEPF